VAYYSFVVTAPQPVGIPKPLLMLDKGLNVFNLLVDDLDTLLTQFKNEGVVVQKVNRLDAHEPGNPTDLLLGSGDEAEG
jgi:hypothetical protein